MFKRSKKKDQAASEHDGGRVAPSSSKNVKQLEIYDGKGHRAIMEFSTDSDNRVVQRLRKDRGWAAKLSHVKR